MCRCWLAASDFAAVVPIYIAFVIIAVAIGKLSGRVAGLDVPAIRAVIFSVATRNSLVVLPLALALPAVVSIAPLAVGTQTLIELVAMVVLVRGVPGFACNWKVVAGASTRER